MKKSIEYIIEVAKMQSITRAANNLYITPSALSKFIQVKEKELDVHLFDRIGKKFLLTYAGERYIEWGNEILAIQNNMMNELNDISRGKKGKVHLGFTFNQAKKMIYDIVPRFKKSFKNIEIILEENSSYELENMLINNEIDFAIMSVNTKSDKLIYYKLMKEEMILAVPNDSEFIEKAIKKSGFKYPWIDITLLDSYDFIVLYPEQQIRKFSEFIFEYYNICPNKPIQVHTVDTSLRCVENRLGVTITLDNLALSLK